jgi:hypothetical protein
MENEYRYIVLDKRYDYKNQGIEGGEKYEGN